MVYVGEIVHARLWIVAYIANYTVYYARCAGRRGNFAGIEYVERQCVVRLIACTVGYGYSLGETKLCGSFGGEIPLHGESGMMSVGNPK